MRPRSRALATLAVLLSVVLLSGALLSGCTAGGAPAGGAPATGQGAKTTLKTAFQADMSTFDPDNGFEVAGLGAIRAVYEGLVDYAPGTTTVVGRLAEKFDVSPDGLTYTFTLRQGVTFHDGTPLTAAAVKASFARRATPTLSLSYFLASVKTTEARDDRTFVVTLSAPQPSFLDALASAWGPKVVSPEGLRQVAADPAWLNEHASGTGPFQLTSFRRGQGYTLQRFDRYWGTAPAVQEVDIAIVPDIGQQVLQLRSGQLDVVAHGYPFAQLEQLPAGLAVSTYDDLGLEMGYVNPVRTLKTAEQRRRVAAAVAPQKWVADAFGRFGQPAHSLYPKAMLDPAQPYVYPTAQQVGTPAVPPIEIAYTADEAAVQQRVADLLIAQLRDAGIQATARSVPSTQVSSFTTDAAHAPDILLAQNNPDSAHPASQAGLFFATGAPLNVFGYSNPAADAQFTRAATLPAGPERDAAYAEAGRVVFDDGGFLPLADVADVVVHRDGLTDLGTRPAVPWNVDLGTARWAA